MSDKLNIEDGLKLVTTLQYIEHIENENVIDQNLENKKIILTTTIRNLITQLGLMLLTARKNEDMITEKIESELLQNIYEQDPLYPHVRNYMTSSRSIYLLQEQIQSILCQFIKDNVVYVNNLSQVQTRKMEPDELVDPGEPTMTEEQRNALKSNTHALAIHYKDAKDSIRKNMVYRLFQLADTKEKYALINSIFYEIAGVKVLDKYSEERHGN